MGRVALKSAAHESRGGLLTVQCQREPFVSVADFLSRVPYHTLGQRVNNELAILEGPVSAYPMDLAWRRFNGKKR